MSDTTSLIRDYQRITERLFTADYLNRARSVDPGPVAEKDVDECVRFMAGLCYSPRRLQRFVCLADPVLLRAVHARHERIADSLRAQGLRAGSFPLSTDGEILRAFLIDLWHADQPTSQ